jgi:hypothetical protein
LCAKRQREAKPTSTSSKTIEKNGKHITTRTAVAGQVGSVFWAAGIARPPNLHEYVA